MMNKIKWYNSFPLTYGDTNIKCHKCGSKTIKTLNDKNHTLYACTNNNCRVGFFKLDAKQ